MVTATAKSIVRKILILAYNMDDREKAISHTNFYTSEDLKWNALGVLDLNSLLVSDP